MITKRIIPCLDVMNGHTVKGVNFHSLTTVGDPVDMGIRYTEQGADELTYLDISATTEGRITFTDMVSRIAKKINIPFTVGGGISSIHDAKRLLYAGADKIAINTAAVNNPQLIEEIANKFGRQFIVVAIDAIKLDNTWRVATHAGRNITNKKLFDWALEVEKRGAGELLFTSMDNDGTKSGYAVEAYAQLSELVNIPLIASGGAGSTDDIAQVLTKGKVDAALAASIFHYNKITIRELKQNLQTKGINIRLCK